MVVVCVGDYVPGRIGALEISRDGGASWTREPLPVTPNSTMYWLATHPQLPGTIVATSLFGQVYVSDDHAARGASSTASSARSAPCRSRLPCRAGFGRARPTLCERANDAGRGEDLPPTGAGFDAGVWFVT